MCVPSLNAEGGEFGLGALTCYLVSGGTPVGAIVNLDHQLAFEEAVLVDQPLLFCTEAAKLGPPPKLPHGDKDSDGCTDVKENGPDETLGGRRNPHNPWDFYDVYGPARSLVLDQIIDLPNDILGVIQHFSPQGQAPYDAQFDRGPSAGPNPWNMSAPDGVIDLPNDILGVILQFGHSCV